MMSRNRARLRIVSSQPDPEPAEERASRRGKARERLASKLRVQTEAAVFDKAAAYTRRLVPKTPGQARLIEAADNSDFVLCLGPAGTGKTHIAVRKAVEWQAAAPGRRIVFVRPAVEAGERLGFLPGGPKDKLDPYMRPFYDALLTCIPQARIQALMAEGIIEIAPLGFMRGRNLGDCFVVMDEAQNATRIQLKMLFTRYCQGSKFMIMGDPDPWQCDVAANSSGLVETVARIEAGGDGIPVVRLTEDDVVRHPLVKRMLELL